MHSPTTQYDKTSALSYLLLKIYETLYCILHQLHVTRLSYDYYSSSRKTQNLIRQHVNILSLHFDRCATRFLNVSTNRCCLYLVLVQKCQGYKVAFVPFRKKGLTLYAGLTPSVMTTYIPPRFIFSYADELHFNSIFTYKNRM